MKHKIILPLFIMFILSSCKKDFTCECADNNGVYSTYSIHDTKKHAKVECDGYCTSCKFQNEGACTLK